MEAGFAAKATGLSFVAPDKFQHFMFVDEDLAQAGLRKVLPSPAEYFRSYLCRSCQLYIIDYRVCLDRAQANQVAEAITSAS